MTRLNPRPIKSGFMETKRRHQYIFKAPQLVPMRSQGWEALHCFRLKCVLCEASFVLLWLIKDVPRWFARYASVLHLAKCISSYTSLHCGSCSLCPSLEVVKNSGQNEGEVRPGFGQDGSSRGPWDGAQETLSWTPKSLALCQIEKEAMDPEKVFGNCAW